MPAFSTRPETAPIRLDAPQAERALLREVREHGAVCLSRFSMELEGASIELLRRAAEQLVQRGWIRRVADLGETYERA